MENNKKSCDRCEVLPGRYGEAIDLYFSLPEYKFRALLYAILGRLDVPSEDVGEMVLAQPRPDQLREMALALAAELGESERADIRVVALQRACELKFEDIAQVQSLESFLTRISSDDMIQLFRDGRLATWVHPIMHCAEPERIFAYECLTRGIEADQSLISPDRLFDVARRADLLHYLDRECRMTSIRTAGPLAKRAKLFINFNPATVYRPEQCLLTTMKTLDAQGLTKEDVVFELVESDKAQDFKNLIDIFDYYRERGFEVALDDFGTGYNSLKVLDQIRPDYIKLDMALVHDVDRDEFKQAINRNMLALARELDIQTIAEGIERPEELLWMQEAGADFAQGFLFGKPSPVEKAAKAKQE